MSFTIHTHKPPSGKRWRLFHSRIVSPPSLLLYRHIFLALLTTQLFHPLSHHALDRHLASMCLACLPQFTVWHLMQKCQSVFVLTWDTVLWIGKRRSVGMSTSPTACEKQEKLVALQCRYKFVFPNTGECRHPPASTNSRCFCSQAENTPLSFQMHKFVFPNTG